MRKKIMFLLLTLVFIFYTDPVCAQDDIEVPAGMEIRKIGDLKIVVPKGAKVEKGGKGGPIFVESMSEYTSRKLVEIEERLDEAIENQSRLQDDIESLNQTVDKLQYERIKGEIEKLKEALDKIQGEKLLDEMKMLNESFEELKAEGLKDEVNKLREAVEKLRQEFDNLSSVVAKEAVTPKEKIPGEEEGLEGETGLEEESLRGERGAEEQIPEKDWYYYKGKIHYKNKE